MRFILIILCISISNKVFTQNILELGRANSFKTMSFYEGESLRFKKSNEDYFITARISGITDDKIKFNNIEIPVSDIDVIDVREKSSNFMRRFGTYFSGASAGYFLIDFINLSVVQKASAADVYVEIKLQQMANHMQRWDAIEWEGGISAPGIRSQHLSPAYLI